MSEEGNGVKWYPRHRKNSKAMKAKKITHRDVYEELPSGKIVKKIRGNDTEARLKRTFSSAIKKLIDVTSLHQPELLKKQIAASIYLKPMEKDAIIAKIEKVEKGERKSIFGDLT